DSGHLKTIRSNPVSKHFTFTNMMSTVLDEGRKQAINEYMISGLQPVKIELDKLSKEIMNLSRSINGVPFNNEFLGSDIQEFKEDKVIM
ncbi:hypothetical protein Tco_0202922, partial [Tanacetum coccineum]